MGGTSTLPAGKKHQLVQLSLQFQEFNEFLPLDESKRDQGPKPMGLPEARLSTEHGPQLSHRQPVKERWIYVFVRRAAAGKKKPTIEVHELHATKDGKYQVVDLKAQGKKNERAPGKKEQDAFDLRVDAANDRVFAALSPIQLTSARLDAYRADQPVEGMNTTLIERRCAEFRFDAPTDPFIPKEWKHVVEGSGKGTKALVLSDPLVLGASVGALYRKNLKAYQDDLQDQDRNARRLLGRIAEQMMTPHNLNNLKNDGRTLTNWNRNEEWRAERLRDDAEWYAGQVGVWLKSGPYVQATEDHVAGGPEAHDRFLQLLAAHQKDLYLTQRGLDFYAQVSDPRDTTFYSRLFEGKPDAMAEEWRRIKNVDSALKATAEVMKGYWLAVLRDKGSEELLRRFMPQHNVLLGNKAYLEFLDPAKKIWVEETKTLDAAGRAQFKQHQAGIFKTETYRARWEGAEKLLKHSLLLLEILNLGLLVAALGSQPPGTFDKVLYYTELAKALSKTAASTAHLFAAESAGAKAMKFAGKVAAIISVIGYGLKLGKAIASGDDVKIVAYSVATIGAALALAALVFEIPVIGWIGAILIVLADLFLMLLRDKPIDVWLKRCEWGKEPKGTITEQFEALLPIVGKPTIKVDLRDAGGKTTRDRGAARSLFVAIDPALYFHGETTYALTLDLSPGIYPGWFDVWKKKQVTLSAPTTAWTMETDDRRVKRMTTLVPLSELFEVDRLKNHAPPGILIEGKLVADFMKNKRAQQKPAEFELDDKYLIASGNVDTGVELL